MAEKRICDICNKNEADRSFQVRKSKKGFWKKTSAYSGFWDFESWTPWEKIDICEECGEKLFNLKQ